MKQTHSLQQKAGQLLIILLPILITQLALCGMNFFDTMMSGHVSQNDLAGVAIGTNIWMPIFTGINGILIAVTPIMAQLYGAGRKTEIPFVVLQGVYLAVALAVTIIICGIFTVNPILILMHLEPAVQSIAYQFLKALALGIVPFFICTVLRSFIDTLGYTRVTMLITLSALPINVLFNYLLIFGVHGFPKLGGIGAGYATAVTYWYIAIVSFFIISYMSPFREYRIFATLYRLSMHAWKEQIRIGVPIGLAIFCETSIFGAMAFLMAKFGTVTIAAYQAALNFASLVYMLPLSIGMALTIVVGFEVGARRLQDARQYGYLGLAMAVSLAGFCAVGLFLFNAEVASWYSTDAEVLQLTKHFLIYAAFFQLSDALAAPIQGVLRGYKDVTVTFVMAMISYWVIGLPTGFILANYTEYGATGYWIGLILGLAVGAIALSARLIKRQRKEMLLQ
ncbi:MATE family efflux transporter [Anaerospora sp.]|uniref:MATE family efflux transporter n=1 Tax=Anaerospora sp. TaxID=1960278 RepID=UPI00289B6540|nr:MATE family efflux transporter [Anaerospora sp.]